MGCLEGCHGDWELGTNILNLALFANKRLPAELPLSLNMSSTIKMSHSF